MDNATRSERSRNAVLEAALAIIARDGPARLTLDAIAKEAGISKGGVTHQYKTKEAVLRALLQRQIEDSEAFCRDYLAESAGKHAQPLLATQIAALRRAAATPNSVTFAILGAAGQDPSLLTEMRRDDRQTIGEIKAETADPDLAMLRWAAAWGLALTAMMGLSSLDSAEQARLFDRLLDDSRW